MGSRDTEAAGDAPPSYGSLFGELKQMKDQSNGAADYAKNATGLCCAKFSGACGVVLLALVGLVFSLGLPIAELVIGGMNYAECPAEKFLTKYLLVLGGVSIAVGMAGSVQRCMARKEQETGESSGAKSFFSFINGAGTVFLMCWTIAGNYYVFRMRKCDMTTFQANTTTGCFTTDTAYSSSPLYCNQLVYDYVYWESIARWIVFGVVIFFSCLCCCICCGIFCCSKEGENN